MDKLFLIRRKLETFVGPLSAAGLKEAYQRMDFGLQDEVAGHCGRWVVLENRKMLFGTYPEIAAIFHPGVADPAISTGSTKPLGAEAKNGDGKRRLPAENLGSRNRTLAALFLVLALGAAGVATYLLQSQNLGSVTLSSLFSVGPRLEDLQAFFAQGDLPGYSGYIEKHREKILREVSASRTKESPWLPYLRFYAFQGRGEFSGLSAKQLKGSGAYTAPADCSLDTWKKTWQSSKDQWADLIYGRKLVKAHWGRLLAWDPHWIRRRHAAGWLEPPSFHGACIYMAYLGFEELVSDPVFLSGYRQIEQDADEVMASIRSRLGWLSYIVNKTDTFNGTLSGHNATGFLSPSYWTCMEASAHYGEMDSCKRGYTPALPLWISFEENRLAHNLIRLTIRERKKVPDEILQKLEAARPTLVPADLFTRFDVRAEISYLDQLLKNRGDAAKSVPKPSQDAEITLDFSVDLSN